MKVIILKKKVHHVFSTVATAMPRRIMAKLIVMNPDRQMPLASYANVNLNGK